MKKVIINLNPRKEKISGLALQNVVSYTPVAAISAILLLVLLLLLNVVILKQAASYRVYNKHWREWSQKAKTIQEAKVLLDKLKIEKSQLEKILTPDYQMAVVLEDIFASLPKNVWFGEFDFHDQDLRIEGYIVKWNQDYLATLDEFVRSLRKKEYFSSRFGNLKIAGSEKVDFNGQEVLKFIIECRR